ncbi:MAG: SUMF1/EgtB/PvdO family nonheme iron enzyme [Caldilineaceae bacterium]
MNVDQVRLLIIQANPPGSVALGTDVEERKLQEALRRGQERDLFAHPAHLPAARVSDLLTELRAHQPQILHFTGHGDGAGGPLLNAPDDRREAILTATDLAALLQVYQAEAAAPLQLVVLAGCQTAGVADLLVKHVGCVVAVAGDIHDDAVRDALTPSFYAALSDGRSVANAVASAQSVMTALGFATDAALLHPYTCPGLDPATMRPRDWLQPATHPSPPATRHTSLHLDYLRHWFTQPWTRVALADLQPDQPDHAHLLDLYVPLPVACTLVIKTKEGRIVDWWVKGAGSEVAGGEERATRSLPAELYTKPRQWTDLRVGEAELGRLVAQRQQTLDQRRGEDRPIRDDEHEWPLAAHHAAMLQPRFVLLGDPGSGKSSFLRHLTLCLAGALRQEAGAPGVPATATLAALGEWELGGYTPIYVELRDLVRTTFPVLPTAAQERAKQPTAETFWHYVRDPLLPSPLTAFARDLRTLADEGQAILLLDGLDEVPQADDPRRREQVKALIAALVNDTPKLRIIVGSRPYAYQVGEWALAGFGQTTLQPLHREGLQALAAALFAAALVTPPQPSPAWGGSSGLLDETSVPPPIRGREPFGRGGGDADHAAKTFVAALTDHPHLDERLYANPLFFTLLAALWLTDTAQRLPTTQAELYRRAVDLLLDRWARRRAPDLSVVETLGLTVAELRPVLESFACTVQETAQPGADTTTFRLGDLLNVLAEAGYNPRIQDVATYLERHAGLLVSPRRSYFYFSHRSFQEHLAACELTCRDGPARRPPVTIDRRFPDGLSRRVQAEPARWRTVAYLAAGELMTQGRTGETLLWELLEECCQPYITAGRAPAAVVIALGIARHHDLFDLRPSDRRYRRHLEPLRQVALQVLTDVANFTPAERNIAGELLGRHPEHDTRKGVGRRADGLPDIDWVEIPESDAQGRREFIYQRGERRVEPTFWLARYPITYSQFQAFLDADDGFANSLRWEGLAAPYDDRATPDEQYFKFWNHPRDSVSWYDAMAFCRWLTTKAQAQPALLPLALQGQTNWRITLPTEWQWEKAARGHDGRQYPWGDAYQAGYANINETYQKDGPHYLAKTSAVGMYPHGASPYGLLDMSGNVWERCLNEYDNPDRTQAEGGARCFVRGGSWGYGSPQSSALARDDDWALRRNLGFRVVVGVVVPVP